MKRTSIVILMAVVAFSQQSDVKRNQQLQKLQGDVRAAQSKLSAFLTAWVKDCEAKGESLESFSDAHLACATPPPPSKAPSK
jgi:type II secretory pathway pseudopilin PulG